MFTLVITVLKEFKKMARKATKIMIENKPPQIV
jgi:hypothetical protein